MTPKTALIDLLDRVGAAKGAAVLVTDDELSQWPAVAVAAMKSQKLLARARPAASVVCPGCEQECLMPVHAPARGSGPVGAFVVCDKRSDINRVPIVPDRLRQWRCDIRSVAVFLSTRLGLRRGDQRQADAGVLRIGMASGEKRTQMLCLRSDGALAVVASSNAVPLSELVGYHDDGYQIDEAAIRRLVDSATTADPRYTPGNAKREARKLDTQARHERWKGAYRTLRKQHPSMSDVWISRLIAKQRGCAGVSPETIRRNMKR
jgi:hypothetical protein